VPFAFYVKKNAIIKVMRDIPLVVTSSPDYTGKESFHWTVAFREKKIDPRTLEKIDHDHYCIFSNERTMHANPGISKIAAMSRLTVTSVVEKRVVSKDGDVQKVSVEFFGHPTVDTLDCEFANNSHRSYVNLGQILDELGNDFNFEKNEAAASGYLNFTKSAEPRITEKVALGDSFRFPLGLMMGKRGYGNYHVAYFYDQDLYTAQPAPVKLGLAFCDLSPGFALDPTVDPSKLPVGYEEAISEFTFVNRNGGLELIIEFSNKRLSNMTCALKVAEGSFQSEFNFTDLVRALGDKYVNVVPLP
jgi:hypothetical protein